LRREFLRTADPDFVLDVIRDAAAAVEKNAAVSAIS